MGWNWWLVLWVCSGAVGPIAAVIATYVAFQQWRLNRARLNLEGYDRRVKVVSHALELVREISVSGTTTIERVRGISQAGISEYLFGRRDVEYLRSIRTKAMAVLGASTGNVPTSVSHDEAVRWIRDQEPRIVDRFRKYLQLP